MRLVLEEQGYDLWTPWDHRLVSFHSPFSYFPVSLRWKLNVIMDEGETSWFEDWAHKKNAPIQVISDADPLIQVLSDVTAMYSGASHAVPFRAILAFRWPDYRTDNYSWLIMSKFAGVQ